MYSTTVSNFIKALEKKEEIWFSKFWIQAAPQHLLLSSLGSFFSNKVTYTSKNPAVTERVFS